MHDYMDNLVNIFNVGFSTTIGTTVLMVLTNTWLSYLTMSTNKHLLHLFQVKRTLRWWLNNLQNIFLSTQRLIYYKLPLTIILRDVDQGRRNVSLKGTQWSHSFIAREMVKDEMLISHDAICITGITGTLKMVQPPNSAEQTYWT